MRTQVDETPFLDPVFLAMGQKVYTYNYIEQLREENLQKKVTGKRSYNLVPQKGFQEKVLLSDADILVCGGKRGGGKAISIDSQVVTPFGMRRYGDLKVGDIVTDPVTGGMEKVLQIYEHPQKDLYEITFDDGTTCECCEEHLWKVRRTGYTHKRRNLYGLGVEDDYRIWTFGMMKKWLDEQSEKGIHCNNNDKGHSKNHLVIPLTAPVRFTVNGRNRKAPDIDPYVIGALIGDGCMTNEKGSVCLASADEEIVQQFINAGLDMSHISRHGNSKALSYRVLNSQIVPILKSLKLLGKGSADKFIPFCYKFGTLEMRYSIVRGLMDTDGYCDKRGHLSYTTVSKQLAEDFLFVVRSLGCWAKLSVDTNTGYKDKDGNFVKCKDAYTVFFKAKNPQDFFRLTRKKERCASFNGGVSEVAKRIISYRYIGKKDARCITVDSPNALYAIQDFIVTHNTWTALYKALYNIYNPDVYCYAFRRLEDDIKRGPWKACKPVYRGFGTSFKETSYEVTFLQGKGCSVKMEHLADLGKVSDRLRGAELAYAMLEEVTEHTRENVDIIWDIASVNRNTAGIHSQLLCTCNPVGWSNKLRKLLEWYIDPETDTVIPERDGKIRYMFNYGSDITEIAWGDSWEEVYDNPKAHEKIDVLLMGSDLTPKDLILTLQFIEGDFSENKILQVADKRYVAKLATKGGANVVNDMRGIWRDVDSGTSLLSLDDMRAAFNNVEQRDGVMRASADVALSGDFFVIYALDGHHVCDIEAWRGVFSDEVVTFVRNFLKRNGVREENFTYDSNGLGLWLKGYFRRAQTFNNKAAPSDTRLWNNLKSECAEKFVKNIKDGKYSFAPEVLMRKFTDSKKQVFTVQERLENERLAIKRKDDVARFEIISKQQMKEEIAHSPDFIEGLFMVEQLFFNTKTCVRKGFGAWGGRNW